MVQGQKTALVERIPGERVWYLGQYWPGGKLRSEASWRTFKADGPARLWNSFANLIQKTDFVAGSIRESIQPDPDR